MTKYYKLCGLHHRHFWRLEVRVQDANMFGFWWGPPSWLADDRLLPVCAHIALPCSYMWGKEVPSSFQKAAKSLMRILYSWPDLNLVTPPKAPPLNTSKLGIRALKKDFEVTHSVHSRNCHPSSLSVELLFFFLFPIVFVRANSLNSILHLTEKELNSTS